MATHHESPPEPGSARREAHNRKATEPAARAAGSASARRSRPAGKEGPVGEPGAPPRLQLEIPIHEVVLLETPEALADLAGANRADPVDGLELAVTRPHDGVER